MDVGFIGLGLMGRPMALNLIKAGHRVHVWSRRRESMQPLLDAGAGDCASAAEVARHASVTIGMVSDAPDVDAPQKLAAFFKIIQKLAADDMLLAYHDRSDGGLFACVAEMAFASRCGLALDIGDLCDGSPVSPVKALFSELPR